MIVPEEVARLVLFLAADDSAAITNQSFVIDAGCASGNPICQQQANMGHPKI